MTTPTIVSAPSFRLHSQRSTLRGLVIVTLSALIVAGFVADVAGGARVEAPNVSKASQTT